MLSGQIVGRANRLPELMLLLDGIEAARPAPVAVDMPAPRWFAPAVRWLLCAVFRTGSQQNAL